MRAHGHVPELLVTFGLSYLVLEFVQLAWGTGPVEYPVPAVLQGPLFTLHGLQFPAYRGFMQGRLRAVVAPEGGKKLYISRAKLAYRMQKNGISAD